MIGRCNPAPAPRLRAIQQRLLSHAAVAPSANYITNYFAGRVTCWFSPAIVGNAISYAYNTGAGGASRTFELVDAGRLQDAADNMSRNTPTTVNGRRVVARGLIDRRREESAPFRQNQHRQEA
jgi:hypothetical protein